MVSSRSKKSAQGTKSNENAVGTTSRDKSAKEQINGAESIDYPAKYRKTHYEEVEHEKSNIFRQITSKIKQLWFQVCITLGAYMLDPWEQFLYLSTVLLLIGVVVSAIVKSPLGAVLVATSHKAMDALTSLYTKLMSS